MRIDFSPSEWTSLGVEWELELLDLDTRELTGVCGAVLAAISPDGGGEHPKTKHELLQSWVELRAVKQTIADLVEQLLPTARGPDCTADLEAIPRLMDRGASCQHQRAVAAANDGELVPVVDLLLSEMQDGLKL